LGLVVHIWDWDLDFGHGALDFRFNDLRF